MHKEIQYADAELGWLDDLVDTTRYPLDDEQLEWQVKMFSEGGTQ